MSIERFVLSKDNSVLVIVDIQERLAVAMDKKDRVVGNTLHLIEAAKLLSLPIIVTEQYSKGLGPTLPEIKSALTAYAPIEKITFSCCGEPGFMKAMSDTGRKQAIVVGMETHVCVWQTCLDLLREGYAVHLVRDAVCSRAKINYKTGLELARDAGAVVTSTEVAMFQLLVRAGSQEFKTISGRIK